MSYDVDAWLDSGKRPEAVVQVCLSGGLHQQHLDRVLELDEALKLGAAGQLSMEDNRIPRLRDEVEALREQIAEHSRTLTLRAMDEAAYYALVLAHPPRDGHEVDARHGVNYDTFCEALVQACLVDPAMTAEQVTKLHDKVSYRQWAELWQTARSLCTDEVSIPKSLNGSAATPS